MSMFLCDYTFPPSPTHSHTHTRVFVDFVHEVCRTDAGSDDEALCQFIARCEAHIATKTGFVISIQNKVRAYLFDINNTNYRNDLNTLNRPQRPPLGPRPRAELNNINNISNRLGPITYIMYTIYFNYVI